jgi:soluble lytic murein transglycosylase-like protein
MLMLAALPAHAALWGYVDGAGVAHFAHHQVDGRYSLVLGDDDAIRVPGKKDGGRALLTWLEIAPQVKALQPLLREAAAHHGVDVELLKALIAVESGFDPNVVSPKGAVGLMQITPETADRYATRAEKRQPAAQRLRDARVNVHTGARMLADLLRRFGRVDVALAAWNAGEGTVRRHGGELPPIAETRAHVQMVLELYWALLQRNLPRQQLRLHDTPAAP